VDIVGPEDTPIRAFFDGVIAGVNDNLNKDQGYSIYIKSTDGQYVTKYFHLQRNPLLDLNIRFDSILGVYVDKATGQPKTVVAGEQIARLGRTGSAETTDQPHLHFELHRPGPNGEFTGPTTTPLDPSGCFGAHY
jgi:murein DD-endopeptidase MepM/ murein hydrolase activator NlpD